MATKTKNASPAKALTKALRNTTDVAVASYLFAGSTATVLAAIKSAVEEKQSVEKIALDFRAGRLARSLELPQEDAIAKAKGIVGAAGFGRTPKPGQAVRTEGEQQLFESTKRWWSRIGRDAGVIKPRQQKPRTPQKPEASAAPGKDVPKEKKPAKVKSAEDAKAGVLNGMHQLAAFVAKNHKLLPVEWVTVCNGAAVQLDKLAKAK